MSFQNTWRHLHKDSDLILTPDCHEAVCRRIWRQAGQGQVEGKCVFMDFSFPRGQLGAGQNGKICNTQRKGNLRMGLCIE